RPREQHEVDPRRDGGELLNQGPHPVDGLRLIGGGMLRSVRGTMRDFGLPARACAGYISAFMEFEDGTPATLVYDGYGYIGGWEMVPWGETPQRQAALEAEYEYRRRLRAGLADEDVERETARFCAGTARAGLCGGEPAWVPSSPGNILVACERGE